MLVANDLVDNELTCLPKESYDTGRPSGPCNVPLLNVLGGASRALPFALAHYSCFLGKVRFYCSKSIICGIQLGSWGWTSNTGCPCPNESKNLAKLWTLAFAARPSNKNLQLKPRAWSLLTTALYFFPFNRCPHCKGKWWKKLAASCSGKIGYLFLIDLKKFASSENICSFNKNVHKFTKMFVLKYLPILEKYYVLKCSWIIKTSKEFNKCSRNFRKYLWIIILLRNFNISSQI